MKQWILIGVMFIFLGIGLFAYYDSFVKPDKEARELLVEGRMAFEMGTKESTNKAIDILTKVIAKYPKTDSALEAFFYIAQSYEKLNLNRLAYLKYIYILKNNNNINPELEREIRARIARLKIMKRYDEEGIHQLLSILNYSDDKDFRSRVYTELGHTYLKRGEFEKSRRMFDLALAENGSNEEAILGKARVYKRIGHDSDAYEMYDHFLKYFSNFSYYTNDVTSSYVKQLYDSGLNSYRKGRYWQAISFFQKFLKQFPTSERAENSLYWIGESYFAMKDYNNATTYFRKVQSNGYYHKDQDALIKTGYAYFLAKNYDLASREFQAYIDTYPNGKYINKAKQWKEMSTKEIQYKYQNNKKDGDDTEEETEEEDTEDSEDSGSADRDYNKNKSKTVQTSLDADSLNDDDENMAEL